MPKHMKPYYRAYPSDFLTGVSGLTAEEIGVYRTLLDLMYDRWKPIPWESLAGREFMRHRRKLADTCGCTVTLFGKIVARLLVLEKLQKNSDKMLTNPRFERERAKIALVSDENVDENAEKKSAEKSAVLSDNNGLHTPFTRAPESRVQSPDSAVQGTGSVKSDPHEAADKVIESEITTICKAIGVVLTASTKRHGWPAQWVRMRTELDLTVVDMVAAIDSYPAQFKGDTVRSLGLFKDRAIEKRQARVMNDRIAGRVTDTKAVEVVAISVEQWTEMLTQFIRLGSWNRTTFGPSPLEDGCIVPITMLDNAERYWIKNGNHPEFTLTSGSRVPWRPGTQLGSITEVTPFYRSRTKA